jgi:hypothetical protein
MLKDNGPRPASSRVLVPSTRVAPSRPLLDS